MADDNKNDAITVINDKQYLKCDKCGQLRKVEDFYRINHGHYPLDRYPTCKRCLTQYVDNKDPQTFLWILKIFDVPFVERVWIKQYNTIFLKDPGKFGPMSVLGMYLRIMSMSQYKDFHFSDSDHLNEEERKAARVEEAQRRSEDAYLEERERELQTKLKSGEIDQRQYNTLSAVISAPSKAIPSTMSMDDLPELPKASQDVSGSNSENTIPISSTVDTNPLSSLPALGHDMFDESSLREGMSEDDIKRYVRTWGITYKPSEWLKMESLYDEYVSQYEMSIDRDQILRNICKLTVKMDRALDVDDIHTYKDLSTVFDQMRKSGKFTEAQRKEESKREIDSVGELVAFVEQNSDTPIPRIPVKDCRQDKVDFFIRDMQQYVDHLVRDDLGLSTLIESFIERMESSKGVTVDEILASSLNDEDSITQEANNLIDTFDLDDGD